MFYPGGAFSVGVLGLFLWGGWVEASLSQTIIRPDNTLPGENSVVDAQSGITFIEGGAARGNNLFHSFDEFTVRTGEGAYFLVPDPMTENVFSRVTGTEASNINGILGALTSRESGLISGANFYFMNPNGVVFGTDASLNLGGSLVVTTADAVRFGEAGLFSTQNTAVSELLTINPSAFLFERSQVSPIAVGSPAMIVSPGQSLSLLGGDIDIRGSLIPVSSGGLLQLGSIAGAGEVKLGDLSDVSRLEPQGGNRRANVSIENSSLLLIGAGAIEVYAQNIAVSNGSLITSVVLALPGFSEFDDLEGGDVTIRADGNVGVDSSLIVSGTIGNENEATENSRSGNLSVAAREVRLTNDSVIGGLGAGTGNAGDIDVQASDRIYLEASSIGSLTSSLAASQNPLTQSILTGTGSSGNVMLQAPHIVLTNTAIISAAVASASGGDAGNVRILASDTFLMDDGAILSTTTAGRGNAGLIEIYADNLVSIGGGGVAGGSAAISSSVLPSPGAPDGRRGGNISIASSESGRLLLDGAILSSNVRAGAVGDGGNIVINAGSMLVTNTGQIQSTLDPAQEGLSAAIGRAGSLNVTVLGLLRVETASSDDGPSGFFTTARLGTVGDAGAIALNADSIELDRAVIQSVAAGTGNAGQINIRVGGLRLRNTVVSSSTFGRGNGGNIRIIAEDIDVGGAGTAGSASRILSGTGSGAVGEGGNIQIETVYLLLDGGSEIAASSFSGEAAGDILIDATGKIVLRDAEISTTAANSSGGDIFVNTLVGDRSGTLLLEDGDITTESFGNGGNIRLSLPVIAIGDSDIIARSQDANGGNITLEFLFSDTVIPDAAPPFDGDGKVDVNADGQISAGVIEIPDASFVQDDLAELSENFIDFDSLVESSCIARSTSQNGTFVIDSMDGLANQPGDTTASYRTGEVRTVVTPAEVRTDPRSSLITEPDTLYELSDGRFLLSRDCS